MVENVNSDGVQNQVLKTELTDLATPKKFIRSLDAMWEAWLTNETTDTANAHERAEMLYLYKGLRKFLKSLR